ncbi:MAG: GTPase [Peptostreptococcaceae bacterium]
MNTNWSEYRCHDIDSKLKIAKFYPLDVMITGVTGAGKSTTLNSLFQKNVAKVGSGVDPETMELDSYKLNEVFRIWDTPGLGDCVDIDKIHEKKLVDLLYKTYSLDENTYGFIDMAIVIIEGANRDMGTTYKLLNEVIVPNIQNDRIFIVINQADVAMKGRHWDHENNKSDNKLQKFLDEQALSIKNRIKEATNIDVITPIYYSAEKNYNVNVFFDFIIDNMPLSRRNLIK